MGVLKRWFQGVVWVGALTAPFAVQANDSSSALKAGGVVLTQSDEIAMESENLVINSENIFIDYRFRNTSDKAVTTRIAFPLPDISFEDAFYNHPSFPVDDPMNFVGFQTKVNGAPVVMESSHRMWVKGKDVTEEYMSVGFPPSMADRRFFEKADKEFDDALLARLGANKPSELIQKTHFHWRQTFPPKQTVQISHVYKPVAGYVPIYGDMTKQLISGIWREQYCIDDAAARKINALYDLSRGEKALNIVREVDYILTTGNNWKEAIESFRLRVEAKGRYSYAAFCTPDGKAGLFGKVLEIEYEKFRPKKELNILFFGAWR